MNDTCVFVFGDHKARKEDALPEEQHADKTSNSCHDSGGDRTVENSENCRGNKAEGEVNKCCMNGQYVGHNDR